MGTPKYPQTWPPADPPVDPKVWPKVWPRGYRLMASLTTPHFDPSTPPASPQPAPTGANHGDIASSVDASTPCMTCGYDLVGLLADGICPECSTLIAKTLTTPRLAIAPTEFLVQLRRRFGYALLMCAVAVVLVPLCGLGFFAASHNNSKIPVALSFFAPCIVIAVTSVMNVVLWRRLTELTAWTVTQAAAPTARRFVRSLSMVELFGLACVFGLLVAAAYMPTAFLNIPIVLLTIALVYRAARFIASTVVLAKVHAQERGETAAHPLRIFSWSIVVLMILSAPLGLVVVTTWHFGYLIALRRSIAATLARR